MTRAARECEERVVDNNDFAELHSDARAGAILTWRWWV